MAKVFNVQTQVVVPDHMDLPMVEEKFEEMMEGHGWQNNYMFSQLQGLIEGEEDEDDED